MIDMKVFIALCGCFFLAQAWAQICPKNVQKENPAYQEVEGEVSEAVVNFGQSLVVAKKADEVLSKLMSAKSPVILAWLKERNFKEKGEEDIVKEWRAYYAKMLVLNVYPQKQAELNPLIERFADSLYQKHMGAKVKKRLSALFDQAKSLSVQRLKALSLPEAQQKKIIKRVEEIKLFWPTPFAKAKISSALDVVSWGIAYNPIPNRIDMGLEALRYPNDETVLAVFIHEIGHSFDPCRYTAFIDSVNPFNKVLECLRGPKSVGAKVRDDSAMDELYQQKKLSLELYQSLKANPTCNKREYPPVGVQADQINESFADWFSAEVLALTLPKAGTPLRADLCEKRTLSAGSSYPANEDRLFKIYLAHPVLQKNSALKAEEVQSASYCPFTL